MPSSASDSGRRRILVCRAESLEAGALLDHVCNGLVSRWKAYGQGGGSSARAMKRGEFVWLLPVYAEVDQAFIWMDPAEIPWERIRRIVGAEAEVFVLGTLSEPEQRAGKASFKSFLPWPPSSPQEKS